MSTLFFTSCGHVVWAFFWSQGEAQAMRETAPIGGDLYAVLQNPGWFWQLSRPMFSQLVAPYHGPFESEADAMADLLESEETHQDEIRKFGWRPYHG